MAYRDAGHRLEVFKTPEYRAMASEYVANGAIVPLYVFQNLYGQAFFGSRGKPEKPGRTATSRRAFVALMRITGRAPSEVRTWEDWKEFSDS